MPENRILDGFQSEIIALAWADEVSFDEIKQKHGLSEKEVILLMRGHLKRSSFKLWRERVSGRKSKHKKRLQEFNRRDMQMENDDGDQSSSTI